MKKLRNFFFLIIVILCVIAGAVVAITLDDAVILHQFNDMTVPLAVIVLAAISLGVLVTLLVCYLPMWLKWRRQMSVLQRENLKCKKEMSHLRERTMTEVS